MDPEFPSKTKPLLNLVCRGLPAPLRCARFAEILQNCVARQGFGRWCSIVFLAYPLGLPIQTFRGAFTRIFQARYTISAKRAQPRKSPPLLDDKYDITMLTRDVTDKPNYSIIKKWRQKSTKKLFLLSVSKPG